MDKRVFYLYLACEGQISLVPFVSSGFFRAALQHPSLGPHMCNDYEEKRDRLLGYMDQCFIARFVKSVGSRLAVYIRMSNAHHSLSLD